jgi:hypothetical protein
LLAGLACASAQTDWTQLSPAGGPPQARGSHTAVLHASNGSMIVFGGSVGGIGPASLVKDVWIFQDARTDIGNTWQRS